MNRGRALRLYRRHVSEGKVSFYRSHLMTFVTGERSGCYLHDLSGRRLMNFHCNGGVFNLGHNNPETSETARRALERWDLGSPEVPSEPKRLLSARLAELAPAGLTRSRLSASGSEAVELAIKLAKARSGRTGVISARGAYHGGGGFAIGAGDPAFRAPFGPPPPGFRQVEFGDIAALEREAGDGDAAVIVETIPATLGMPLAPADYFPRLRRLCDERGLSLIVDEVQTGLGRTGRLWAISHWGVDPDILVIGKGLSGGVYPIAATCFRPEFERAFEEYPLLHQTDFGGADLGCQVALKVLEISSAPGFLAQVNELADFFAEGLERLRRDFGPWLVEIRQKGLFIGLRFSDPAVTTALVKLLFDNGLYAIYSGNDKRVLQFLPPLVISRDEAREGLAILEKSLAGLSGPKGRLLRFLLRLIGSDPV